MSETTSDLLALCVMGLFGLIFAAMVGQWIVLRIIGELRRRRPVESKPCPHCGALIPVNPDKTVGPARYCPRCGKQVAEGEEPLTLTPGQVVYLNDNDNPLTVIPANQVCGTHGAPLVWIPSKAYWRCPVVGCRVRKNPLA